MTTSDRPYCAPRLTYAPMPVQFLRPNARKLLQPPAQTLHSSRATIYCVYSMYLSMFLYLCLSICSLQEPGPAVLLNRDSRDTNALAHTWSSSCPAYISLYPLPPALARLCLSPS